MLDAGLQLSLPPDVLKPLIRAVVAETIAPSKPTAALPDAGRLAFGESEAARMLGMNTHQLRDERLRNRIAASVGPGRRILYARQDLLNYLAARRWEAGRG